MADRVGQQLGNYRLVRLLGTGGFAEVYLGEHLRLKSQAAIKVLHTSLEDDDVEGFLREAQTVGRLKHPHIVRVFDFDVEAHTPFLVMDYLPNGNSCITLSIICTDCTYQQGLAKFFRCLLQREALHPKCQLRLQWDCNCLSHQDCNSFQTYCHLLVPSPQRIEVMGPVYYGP